MPMRGHGGTLWGGRNVLYLNQSMSCMGVSMNQSIQLRLLKKWCSLSFTHLQSSLGPSHSFFPLCFPQFMLPIPSQASHGDIPHQGKASHSRSCQLSVSEMVCCQTHPVPSFPTPGLHRCCFLVMSFTLICFKHTSMQGGIFECSFC